MNKLKISTYLFILTFFVGITTFSSCTDPVMSKTTVEITVKDAIGNKSNWTVYQINDTKFNLYGSQIIFKDQQSVTDNNGLATFEIDNLDFATGGQRTYYYFVQYLIGGVSKSKNIGITLSKGDQKSGTLLMN